MKRKRVFFSLLFLFNSLTSIPQQPNINSNRISTFYGSTQRSLVDTVKAETSLNYLVLYKGLEKKDGKIPFFPVSYDDTAAYDFLVTGLPEKDKKILILYKAGEYFYPLIPPISFRFPAGWESQLAIARIHYFY